MVEKLIQFMMRDFKRKMGKAMNYPDNRPAWNLDGTPRDIDYSRLSRAIHFYFKTDYGNDILDFKPIRWLAIGYVFIKMWIFIYIIAGIQKGWRFLFGGANGQHGKQKWLGRRIYDWIAEDQECWRCKQGIGWWNKKDPDSK